MREIAVHVRLERGIGLGLGVSLFQFQDQRHQRLGDKAAAIDAEMPVLVGPGAERVALLRGHRQNLLHHAINLLRRGVARGADEGAYLIRILFAGRALDARGYIDGGRARDAQRDVYKRQVLRIVQSGQPEPPHQCQACTMK